jgi:hypothetical protein
MLSEVMQRLPDVKPKTGALENSEAAAYVVASLRSCAFTPERESHRAHCNQAGQKTSQRIDDCGSVTANPKNS